MLGGVATGASRHRVRVCDIGAMKPDLRPYRWMAAQLQIEPDESVYVENGSSDELAWARHARFGCIVHCNIFDHSNGLVEPEEQLRRAGQADTTVDTVEELDHALAVSMTSDGPAGPAVRAPLNLSH